MLRRLIFTLLIPVKIPFVLFSGIFIIAHIIWCPIVWFFTGKDVFLEDNTPMGMTSNFCIKVFRFPLDTTT